MKVKRSGSQASSIAPAERFFGHVRVDPIHNALAPARLKASSVTFEPGARTDWHKHPLGQLLIVTAGCGRVQKEGEPVEIIYPGDSVWIEPHEKHWHGAAVATSMTHISISEVLEGAPVEWLERVQDESQ